MNQQYANLVRVVSAIGGKPKDELDLLLARLKSSEGAKEFADRMISLVKAHTQAPEPPQPSQEGAGRRRGRPRGRSKKKK